MQLFGRRLVADDEELVGGEGRRALAARDVAHDGREHGEVRVEQIGRQRMAQREDAPALHLLRGHRAFDLGDGLAERQSEAVQEVPLWP